MVRDTSKQKRKKAWLIGIVAGLAFCCAGAMLASHTASMLLESNKKDGLVALPMERQERQERNRDRHRALTALVDNNTPTELVAKGISHTDIDLEDGRYCILDANEVKSIIGEREWMKATTLLTETSDIRSPPSQGAVLRARNERTNTEGGLLMFSNGGTEVYACWNPTKDTKSDDWKVDDVLSLLDYPANDVKSEQLANVTDYSIVGDILGWEMPAENIKFGESGVVGDWWKEMEIEYELSGDNVAIEGIWTDSVELPYTIKYYDEDNDSWVVAKENCLGNVYDLELAKVSAKRWRLHWASTWWQNTRGLSTDDSGGGLHAELVKYTNPTEGPVTAGGDPHFATFNGQFFSFHGECDLVLMKHEGFASGHQEGPTIHIRTTRVERLAAKYSYISGAAIAIGSDILEVLDDGSLIINGEEVSRKMDAGVNTTTFHGEVVTRTFRGSKQAIVVYDIPIGARSPIDSTAQSVQIRINTNIGMIFLEVNGIYPDNVGMMGNPKLKDSLMARDGSTDLQGLWNSFAEEWQVRNDEPQLFQDKNRTPQYPAGCRYEQSTPHPHQRGGSKSSRRRRLLAPHTEVTMRAATEACAGSLNDNKKKYCVDDVMATGHLELAEDPFYH